MTIRLPRRPRAVMLAAVLLAAGCGTTGTTATGTTTETTSTTTTNAPARPHPLASAAATGHTPATHTPATLAPAARRALAAAYLRIARPANRRLDRDFDALGDDDGDSHDSHDSDADGDDSDGASGSRPAAVRAALRDAAATERRFDTALLRLSFPARTELIVHYLVWVNQARATLTVAAATAATPRALAGWQRRLDAANVPVEQAVAIIRTRLGLPPADTS